MARCTEAAIQAGRYDKWATRSAIEADITSASPGMALSSLASELVCKVSRPGTCSDLHLRVVSFRGGGAESVVVLACEV